MKDKEKKMHKGETIIGKIIYGFLMFAPLFAIAITSLYSIINPNAKDSYYGETINEENIVEATQYEANKEYRMIINHPSGTLSSTTLYISNAKNFKGLNDSVINNLTNAIYIQFYSDNDGIKLQIYYENIRAYGYYALGSWEASFDFTLLNWNGSINNINNSNFKFLYDIEYNKYSYVSESFYYSLYQVEQSSIFNWSKNTVIYTGLEAFTNTIGITNTFIPMLMTYWMIITIAYILYDIVLIMLLIAHRKIHDLEDSM